LRTSNCAYLQRFVVSIGIAENIQLARVATRKAKPAGSFHLKSEQVQQVLAPLDIDDLHGFGRSTRQKAHDKLGATTLGQLAKKSKAALCDALGKANGETLYNVIRGVDERKLESDKPRKSVSCDINVSCLYFFGLPSTNLDLVWDTF
jgi:DNA repair protein REV1